MSSLILGVHAAVAPAIWFPAPQRTHLDFRPKYYSMAFSKNQALFSEIFNYFEELRTDFEGAYYGMYFLEIADYYTRENNDEREMLKLLYQSLRALSVPSLSHKLVRYIYELKSVIVNGEFPGLAEGKDYLPATEYTVDYIVNSSIEKLYTFTVTDEVLTELGMVAERICKLCLSTRFHSLEILNTLE